MAPRKKSLGKDAVATCLVRMLHPSQVIRTAFPNVEKNQKVSDLCVRRMEVMKINRQDKLAVVMVSDAFKSDGDLIEVYALPRFVHVVTEGPADLFFGVDDPQPPLPVDDDAPVPEFGAEVQELIENFQVGQDEEDVLVLAAEVDIDDDNAPAPENVPNEGPDDDIFEQWGHDGICFRRMGGATNQTARLKGWTAEMMPSLLQVFEILFFKTFVQEVIIKRVNDGIDGNAVSYGEFLRFLGLWLYMGGVTGPSRRDWFSAAPVDEFDGAPARLNGIMSRNRFEAILKALRYTDLDPPAYRDPFFEVRQMLMRWNSNMKENFVPSTFNCLDESMSTWTNKYTCPGFMFVPRKPWPFGNEYHTISCAKSNVLWGLELVEGKDQPRELPKHFDVLGKTVGLLLRLTEPIWHTGKVVILDSGFCVLKGLQELKMRGVFASALIKKRRYWPKYIRGEEIKTHFENKEVGDVDSWKGNLQGVPFHVYCMKEPDYVMSLMSTYGTNERTGKLTSRKWKENGVVKTKTFSYPEVVANHFLYRHSIDDHNSKRHSPISLEVTWATSWWPNRVFAFLLAVTEINTMLVMEMLRGVKHPPTLEFRRRLSRELIYNPYIDQDEGDLRKSKRSLGEVTHTLLSIPRKKKFRGSQLVPSKCNYPQVTCIGKHRKTRSYCKCSPGVYRCSDCFAEHILETTETLNEVDVI